MGEPRVETLPVLRFRRVDPVTADKMRRLARRQQLESQDELQKVGDAELCAATTADLFDRGGK